MVQTLRVDEAEQTITAGTLVGGRFELERQLGCGAYGEVWRAFDVRNGYLRVAVKFLRSRHTSAEVRRRFAQECSALELLLRHPNIVAIRERGEFRGQDFMVLELLDGITLATWLQGYTFERPPALAEVMHLFGQICLGVAAAHREKSAGPIIHRDIKPANVMLVRASDSAESGYLAKLLDFGVARLGDRRQTVAGQQLGTPLYMAPEQFAGDETVVSTRSDVFALGVLLVEMLTLRPTGPDGVALRAAMAARTAPELLNHLRRCRPDVPEGLWEVVLKALAWNPEARHADAGELLQALGIREPSIRFAPLPLIRPPRRAPRMLIVVAVGVPLLAVAGWQWLGLHRGRQISTTSQPPDLGPLHASSQPKKPAVPLALSIVTTPPDLAVPAAQCGDGINNVSCNILTAAPGSVVQISGRITTGVPVRQQLEKQRSK